MFFTYSNYRSKPRKSKAKWPLSKTEATATSWLENRVFYGVGSCFLGWRFPVYEVFPDGSEIECEKAGPRVWKTPPREERYKFRPLLGHLQGNFCGLVANGSSYVPFITTELDRHSGEIQTAQHIREVMATGRVLKNSFYSACGHRLKWCVEINRKGEKAVSAGACTAGEVSG